MKKVFFIILVISASLIFSAFAEAKIFCNSGTTAHVQDENNISSTIIYYGWGIDFEHKSGVTNWVHMPVPTEYSQQVRYIGIDVFTGSVDAWVSEVHVWDGRTRIKEIAVDWKGNIGIQVLDLGSTETFTSLSVSLKTNAGVESLSHRFAFSQICAGL